MSEWNHDTYLRRCNGLIARGLDERLAHELRWAGDPSLVMQIERATDAQIAELNAQYRSRNA